MVKRRILAVMAAVVLTLAATGLTGVTADALGYSVTAQAQACNNGGSSGGSC